MNIYFEEHSIEGDHGRRSLRAGAAIMGARILVIVIQFVTFFVLARLLSPEDYGLVGMVTAITVSMPNNSCNGFSAITSPMAEQFGLVTTKPPDVWRHA